MKKIITTIIATILSVLIGLTTLAGCNIITTDTEKDLAQVVAEVHIGNENAEVEKIYKKDLAMAYMSYGYYYTYYQGYSSADVFEMLVENLVNNRILIQNAVKEFEAKGLIENTAKEKWDIDRYLSEKDVNEATYNAIKSINDLIDSYETKDEAKFSDTYTEEVRAVPTDAANDTEVTYEEKLDYIEAGILIGEGSDNRRKAYNKVLKVLQDNGLLGEDFSSSLTESQYYKDILKTEKEYIILANYDELYSLEIRSKVTYADLSAKYKEMYEAQVNKYDNNKTEFESAISSYSAKSPIVYSPFSGYGFVYNLLLGASAEQTEAINAIKEKEVKKRQEARKAILDSTTAKDLRSSWIVSGYDFSTETKTFTGDYTFAEDAKNSLPFQGEFTVLAEKTEDKSAEYRVDSVKEFGLDEFIKFMEEYIYGAEQADAKNEFYTSGEKDSLYENGLVSVYKAVKNESRPEEYENKINELLFAFSTDGGSLNTYKGYSITPKPDNGGAETYVQEFADAGRKLMEIGGSSYMIVASDYGYHIMFYSQILGAEANCPTLTDYLNKVSGENHDDAYWTGAYASILADWENADESDYLYILSGLCSNVDSALQTKKDEIVNTYKHDETYVVYHEDAYADLLGE